MHVLVTDSGVGGLSVVAYAERFVRMRGYDEPVKLTFANAAPSNDYGYNSMPTREAKIETFDRFLRSVAARYEPDSIYVACNTLSVLLPETPFFARGTIPVKGIVETGAELLLRAMEADPQSVAMIFGTQTTIDAGAYPRILQERAIESSRIVSQACPGLADTISEDRDGIRTLDEIRGWVDRALEKSTRPDAPVLACLACTHYGYRRELFAAAFAERGVHATIVNPNERAVGDLFGETPDDCSRETAVRFVTRYAIPPETIETLTFYVGEVSPKTVAAMQRFDHVPDLF